jgi:hypothetical protein
VFFLPSLAKMVSEKKWSFLLTGFAVGMITFPGHYGQAMGLMNSTADKGAFICSLSAVWVAFLDGLLKQKVDLQVRSARLQAPIISLVYNAQLTPSSHLSPCTQCRYW